MLARDRRAFFYAGHEKHFLLIRDLFTKKRAPVPQQEIVILINGEQPAVKLDLARFPHPPSLSMRNVSLTRR